MTLRPLILTLSLCLAALPALAQKANPAIAAETPATKAVEKKLTALDKDKGTEAALHEVGTIVSATPVKPDAIMGVTRFLAERDKTGTDPRYGLTLSVIEAKLANTFARLKGEHKRDAAIFKLQSISRYFANSLLLRQDAMRCADPSAGTYATQNWLVLNDDLLKAYGELDAPLKKEVRDLATKYNKDKANRPAAAYACRDGMKALAAAMDAKAIPRQDLKTAEGVKAAYAEADAKVDPYVTFLDNAAWKKRADDAYKQLMAVLK